MFRLKNVTFLTFAFLLTIPIAVEAKADFSMVGEWSGSPDCPITFYRDDGQNVEGNCDNGNVDHAVRGRYSAQDRIDITITRKDSNNCKTSVKGFIQVIDADTVKYSQQGWNGCGVRTRPITGSIWTRK